MGARNGTVPQVDVIVVGGSVAGAATALFLARRGRRVALVDRGTFPRDKPCGEGLMPNGLEVLAELGLLDAVLSMGARRLEGVRYRLPSGRCASGRFPDRHGRASVALGVRRTVLDDVLHVAARAHENVGVYDRVFVTALQRNVCGCWELETAAGTLSARVLVGADGIHSRVRSLLGWGVRRRLLHRYGVTGHFRFPDEAALPPLIEVLLCEGLEAYVTPLAHGEVLVALLGGRDLMRRMAGDLAGGYLKVVRSQAVLARMLDGATFEGSVRVAGPFAARARRVAGQGALLVGDAAGFLDPITGEGMGSALEQARAAAAVIDRALDSPGVPDLRAYARERGRIVRTTNLLTCVALGICLAPALRGRALRGLQRPGLMSRLLAINTRAAGLGSIRPREWFALLTGW